MRLSILLAACLLLPTAALAQTATLVADRVRIAGDDTLVAEGAVEVLYGDRRLTASRITYASDSEEIFIEGPIVLTEGSDDSIVLADQAALSRDLRRGLLRSARIVLDRQLQLAARQISRAGERYTTLDNVVASSCTVCPGQPTPLWEIRAGRVVHDRLERQIYFENAQFRLAGVPLAYIPRLRLPDPTVERASGFLVPSLRSSSELGAGIRVPYFVTLGRSADVTLAPLVTGSTRTLEFRYRQAFRRGEIEVTGAASADDLVSGTRGYLFATGAFDLPRAFELGFDIEESSDDAYLLDYGYSSADRLESEVRVERVRRDEVIRGSLSAFTVLREGEIEGSDEQLQAFGSTAYERRVPLPRLGGELGFGVDSYALLREPGETGGGRDVARLGVSAGWTGSRILTRGLVLDSRAQIGLDRYQVRSDPDFGSSPSRSFARGTLALRWPLVRAGGGVHETLEPVVQLAWAAVDDVAVPNEESRLVEFDEGNLLALGRLPARDRIETGGRLDLALRYSRLAAGGSGLHLVAGRVLRFSDKDQFAPTTGLDGAASDWLAAAQLDLPRGLVLGDRARLAGDLSLAANELRLGWEGARTDLAAAHVWSATDPVDAAADSVNEATFDAGWQITSAWRGQLEGRYDLAEDRADAAALGLTWRNECLQVDLSLSRRFTSSTSVGPSTDIGVEVALLGFGAEEAAPALRRTCPG